MTQNLIDQRTIIVSPSGVSAQELVEVARDDAKVVLSADAIAALTHGARVIAALADDAEPHYGVSTGFGALAAVSIPKQKRQALQLSLVRSHAASTGPLVEREVVRALMLLRLATLASGRTGVRAEVAAVYADLLNAGITPAVREYGSLGCSGDLAPLAHCALAVIGEGDVFTRDGRHLPAAQALAECGITPVQLREKEGLALINGTDGMLGMLVLAGEDLHHLLSLADVATSLSLEALRGNDRVFAADLQRVRPHRGQSDSAANIFHALQGSEIIAAARAAGKVRVQDAYSLRCAPQVNGAARDTLEHACAVADVELNSVVDNPVLTDDDRLESNGNFHGAPLAYVLDFLAIVVADVASMAERRTDRILDPARNGGLNAFLAADPGTDSGLMIAQYTQAAIVSELKRLASPASVDSIPTSAMQEDHVSMGWSAARKLRRSIDGLERVLAVEILTACRGIRLREEKPGRVAAQIVSLISPEAVIGADEFLSPEIERVVALVKSGQLLSSAQEAYRETGSELR
ncbi:histidine ammonia-lyase [Pseudoclavibacter sp. CFCC 13796]|uniref:histidine ammonia-lyase n=1 Tax=Pseudoclavibacter sp. CFCC 13796 TaxID=2615179 RepID=UPI001301847E|nr:histidine ammonia-lyase [Pseudoclavibacter sp. CFCC 13796]KAB1660871.1 histidine ammonia-lyase [Pseudoclavibacter sp. CFCC 13796]